MAPTHALCFTHMKGPEKKANSRDRKEISANYGLEKVLTTNEHEESCKDNGNIPKFNLVIVIQFCIFINHH